MSEKLITSVKSKKLQKFLKDSRTPFFELIFEMKKSVQDFRHSLQAVQSEARNRKRLPKTLPNLTNPKNGPDQRNYKPGQKMAQEAFK